MKSFYIISIILFLLSSCTCKSVQQGLTNSYKLHRQFFKEVAFKGTIDESEFCGKCAVNKYRLIIKLNLVEPGIDIGNQSFQPYYRVNNNHLIISVTQKTFEDVKEGMEIKKKRNSDFLIIENSEYRILNNDSTVWLPKN